MVKFANPEKYEFVMPDNFTGETLAWAVFSLIGLDGSLASSVIIMLSVTVFLIFRTARMHTVTRYFIFTLSVVTFGVFLAARFTDFIQHTCVQTFCNFCCMQHTKLELPWVRLQYQEEVSRQKIHSYDGGA